MKEGKIQVEGILNEEDANKVLKALNEVWGIRDAELNGNTGEAIFSYDEKAASHEDFEQAVKDMGYSSGWAANPIGVILMNVCEICGHEEEMNDTSETNQTRILHVCENCQNDRRHD